MDLQKTFFTGVRQISAFCCEIWSYCLSFLLIYLQVKKQLGIPVFNNKLKFKVVLAECQTLQMWFFCRYS